MFDQRANSDAQKPQFSTQVDTLQAKSSKFAYLFGILCVKSESLIARHAFEVVVAQLDANGFAVITFAF